MDDSLLIVAAPQMDPQAPVEICRSFSYKLNLANVGGPQYESVDLFASRKMQVPYRHAAAISEMLYQECVAEVTDAVKAKIDSIKAKSMRRTG